MGERYSEREIAGLHGSIFDASSVGVLASQLADIVTAPESAPPVPPKARR
jgi:hypothetical protein